MQTKGGNTPDVVIFAKLVHQFVHFPQIMSRKHGKQVMVDLILQAATEPVGKEVRGDVSCGGDLKLPEVRSLVGGIDSHPIMTQAENQCKHEPTTGLSD